LVANGRTLETESKLFRSGDCDVAGVGDLVSRACVWAGSRTDL